ncbi:MAG: DUF6527 family protein [Polyangia bacterium]
MRREIVLAHEFVEFIPDEIEERTLYVSMKFGTVVHKCCCGCKQEVVTPLGPTDWKLIFDGKAISLDPSIGNWGFACQSHYWIRNSRVRWSAWWSPEEIAAGRAHDRAAKDGYFNAVNEGTNGVEKDSAGAVERARKKRRFWHKVRDWWRRS